MMCQSRTTWQPWSVNLPLHSLQLANHRHNPSSCILTYIMGPHCACTYDASHHGSTPHITSLPCSMQCTATCTWHTSSHTPIPHLSHITACGTTHTLGMPLSVPSEPLA